MTTNNIFRLRGSVQNYEWGRKGGDSLVASLGPRAIGDDFEFSEGQFYAELWMGTHSSGPASLFSDPSTSLHGLVASSPTHFLGARLTRSPALDSAKFPHSTHVPFLFKVLSMAKALPLQAHPDKLLGTALHAKDPDQFPDDNHKPEIAVALKDGFRGFVGFRPTVEVRTALERVPELVEAVGDPEACARFAREESKEALKEIFTKLLSKNPQEVQRLVTELVRRIERQGAEALAGDEGTAHLVMKLNEQYPGDVGVLAAPFFMNFFELDRGQAIYIGADEAHAYLEGDIIECMAVSDNVLNAAFVPPDARNTSTFVNALTYTAREPGAWALQAAPYKHSKNGRTTAYDPPLEEFTVLWTQLSGDSSASEERLGAANGPTIGVVMKGKVQVEEQGPNRENLLLEEGAIVFVKPNTEVVLKAHDGGEAEVWWATCTD